MHEKQKNFEDNLKETEKKRNPFNAKINQMSMANANASRQRRENKFQGETMEYIIDGGAGEQYDFESHRSGFDLMDGGMGDDDIEAKMMQEAM